MDSGRVGFQIQVVVVGFGFTDTDSDLRELMNPPRFERINESNPESKSDKYIKSIIQPNLRLILNPKPNPNPSNMSNP